MSARKSVLRECARLALKERGFHVDDVGGPGIVLGARLRASKGSESHKIAVRTSTDREVGLARRPDGRWATISRVDEVIVVVPAVDQPDTAEVLSFAPEDLMRAFDAALKARKKEKPRFSVKAPIFLPLDEPVAVDVSPSNRRIDVDRGLKAKAQWQTLVPLSAVPRHRLLPTETAVGFIERVRQEFADLHGVDVSKVTVEFRITS
jgi:hypothetical protein